MCHAHRVVVLVGLLLIAACGNDPVTPPETTTSAGAVTATTAPAVTTSQPTASTTQPETTTTLAAETTTSTAAPRTAGAVVEVGDERYEFMIIQCLYDTPSAFGEGVIEFTADGVPLDTPPELIEPLMGVLGPDDDILALTGAVAEYGPLLSISQLDGGGDHVVVYDHADVMVVSDPDPLSVSARFLDITERGAVQGETGADGATMTITATCP